MSIYVKEVCYKISNRNILKNINIEFHPSEIHSILGRNGSGKSTLLKIASGSLKPSSGFIYINNKEISSHNVLELSKIRAHLSQEVLLSVPISVRELVELGRTPYFHLNLSKKDKKISELCLRVVGNFSLKERNILEISGGEKQRTHIARVIAQLLNEKYLVNKYLFLDEAFSNLDIHHQIHILQVLRALANRGLGIIMTLHDLNLAVNFSDKSTILKNGELIASGFTKDVLTEEVLQIAYEYPMQVFHESEERTFIIPKIFSQGVKNGRSKQIF